MIRRWPSLLLLAALAASSRADYRVIDVPKSGTIEGEVHFPGETPPPFMIANRDDHDCPHGIGMNHLFVKQTNLGLQNAIVVLEITRGAAQKIGKAAVKTVGCVLQPRVQIAAQNTNLLFEDGDGAHHELRAAMLEATRFTVPLKGRESQMRRPLVDPGLYRITCDRHAWERAWIWSAEHPYAAVTDASGRFKLENVPPGRYTIRAWHEGWKAVNEDAALPEFKPMAQEKEVVVKTDRTAMVIFDDLTTAESLESR